jgi:hypothetical protein
MLGMVDYKRRLAVGDFWGFDRVAFCLRRFGGWGFWGWPFLEFLVVY